MIPGVLCLLVGAALQQEPAALDVPVYRDDASGVALPRPFPDWVFSPGDARGASTVIFHPRDAPLGRQLWGALLHTTFDEPVRLAEIAERRVRETWRPTLGRSFRMLGRDSLAVSALPAIRLVMSGVADGVAVDVEEYLVAREHDLFLLQFRYPRDVPLDSLGVGYGRVLEGLAIRAATAAAAPAPPAPAAVPNPDSAANRALAGSPWRARAYDALVRFDTAAVRLDFSVRVEVANGDSAPRDSLPFAVPWPLLLDGARSATGRPLELRSGRDRVWVRLPQAAGPGAVTAVSVDFHAPADAALQPDIAVRQDGAHVLDDWLPWVAPWADSTGAPLVGSRPAFTVRFDLPPAFTAVAAGRLAADFVSEGRRRTTWVADREPAPAPEFLVGRLRRAAVRESPLVTLRAWRAARDSADADSRAAAMADVAMEAWRFFTAAFGRLALEDAYLVVSNEGRPGTTGATLRLPPDAPDDSVRAAVARVWWGSAVRFTGQGAVWLGDALPAWSVLLLHQVMDGDTTRPRAPDTVTARGPAAELEALRSRVGDAVFRTAVRRFFLEHRTAAATRAELLSSLGVSN